MRGQKKKKKKKKEKKGKKKEKKKKKLRENPAGSSLHERVVLTGVRQKNIYEISKRELMVLSMPMTRIGNGTRTSITVIRQTHRKSLKNKKKKDRTSSWARTTTETFFVLFCFFVTTLHFVSFNESHVMPIMFYLPDCGCGGGRRKTALRILFQNDFRRRGILMRISSTSSSSSSSREDGERKSFHPISVIAVDPDAVSIPHYSKKAPIFITHPAVSVLRARPIRIYTNTRPAGTLDICYSRDYDVPSPPLFLE